MPNAPRNLDWVRGLKGNALPEDFGSRLYELLSDLNRNDNTLESQTNSNLKGTPAPPPALQKLTVTPTQVGHHVSINHGADFYRGVYYHVEYADNPHFTNPFPAYSGPAREIDLATGSRALYFQAFASYQNSGNTPVVFHGGSIPQPVTGGTGAARGTSQGSGTGLAGEGRQGFGQNAYRGSSPPARSA